MPRLVTAGGALRAGLAVSVTVAVLLLSRTIPITTAEATGPLTMLAPLYTIFLSLLVAGLATALGRHALVRFAPEADLDPIEAIVYAYALGMGLIGVSAYLLGLLGLFRPAWIGLLLVGAAGLASPGVAVAFADVKRGIEVLREDWRQARVWLFVILGMVCAIGLLTLVVALAPPWGYDGLMYHLQAPRLFLQQGRIISLPGILQANGPLLGQMLYALGLAFGSDTFSQVIHLSFAWALVLAVLASGRRLLGRVGGWVAAGVLLGIPIFPLWGTLAYVDMTQALFEFLAVCTLLRWRDDPRRVWLGLSAVLAGFALGTKLMALFMLPALCLWLVVLGRKLGWFRALRLGVAYGLAVCLVAAPWYLFSLISLGDPVYPFLRGGGEWPVARLALHLEYLRSFGTGRNLIDFLSLPWNLYFRHEAFAALMSSIEYPSFLFPLALLIPIVSISSRARPLAVFSLLRLATWYVGSQQTRFLLPLYPVWALMVAGVLLGLEKRLHIRLGYPRLTGAVTSGLVVTTLVYVGIYAFGERPQAAVFGTESRASYLTRLVYDYRAMRYIVASLGPEDRVLQLWDGQSYYCDERCIPDAGQVQAAYLHHVAPTTEEMRQMLEARGATHLLVDLEGLNFLLQHDPNGAQLAAAEFFLNEFLPACGHRVYQDPLIEIYRLTCPSTVASAALETGADDTAASWKARIGEAHDR